MGKQIQQPNDNLAELAGRLKRERRDAILSELEGKNLGELNGLREFWETEQKRRSHSRLYSDPQEREYQEANEMLLLITEALRGYHERKPEPTKSGDDEVLSVRDVAKYLGISESKVREKIGRNEIPYVRIDGQYKFYMPKVREWLATNTVRADDEQSDRHDEAQKRAKEITKETMEN